MTQRRTWKKSRALSRSRIEESMAREGDTMRNPKGAWDLGTSNVGQQTAPSRSSAAISAPQ